jgi:hypothetical protein
MKNLILISILSALFSVQAFAFCKINQYGHNICTGEKALLILDSQIQKNLAPDTKVNEQYKVVIVRSVYAAESKAIIAGTKEPVHLDRLMGNKLCDSNEPLCAGQKVQIKDDCPNIEKKETYKISKVFETERDDVVEVSTGNFIWKKKFLTDAECIDLI